MEDGYDAVVVGSGYGGSVAACRLSMAGINVCLMEKGRKWEAQDFPTNSFNILSAYRVENKNWGFSLGSKDALIQMFEQDDSVAAIACGLGGGSLINAGVMVSTPVRARRNRKWPKEWNSDWEVCEASASAMLGIQSSPIEFPNSKVTRQIIEEEIEDCIPNSVKLSINFGSKESSTNLTRSQETSSCLACGNCLSGCPYDAKNSTDKNYLASAVKAGCTIKTGCQVQFIVRNLDETCAPIDESNKKLRRRWRVYLNATDYTVCDFVIISAGVLGTSKILFQSARRGLNISERLGYGFSTNGNNCAYLGLSSAPLSSYGLEKHQFSKTPFEDRPGPSISSLYTSSLGFSIQPSVLPLSFPYLLFKGIVTYGWPSGYSLFHGIVEKLNHMLGLKSGQAMILNVMGYDDSDGRITLEKESDKICFTPPHDPLLPKKIQALQKITKRLGGILFMSRKRSTSVHLLGGSNASSDPSQGVCDHNGRVFTSESSTTIHPGLYVCDASLIPCSIGINPCLTIATAAEHVSRYLVQDALTYKAHISSRIQGTSSVEKTVDSKSENIENEKIVINETMRGHIGGMPCTAYLTMKMNSTVKKGSYKKITSVGEPHPFLRGKVGGYVIFKSVEKDRLYIIDGEVDMCKVDGKTPYTQYMHYYLVLASASGSRYVLEGRKIMNPFILFSYAWWESRTLHVTFKALGQRNTERKIDLTGELSLSLVDLLRSVIGLEGNAKGRFICLLLQSFFRTYILQIPRANHHNFLQIDLKDKPYPPSIYHEVITGNFETENTFVYVYRFCDFELFQNYAEDGVLISCRQWKCKQDPWRNDEGKSLPVLLINGYSTESYCLPTEPNDLVRTLLEFEHETWLLQPRLHPLHPSNNFTFEDVAKFDIPAALKKIGELHGTCAKVHAVAHCVGGLAIHIALMGGHISANQIASLSCTNSSMFFKITTSSMFKMSLPIIPISMRILGKERILPMFQNSESSSPSHSFLKLVAKMIPRYERCTFHECEVFSGIFGNTFWHENLSSSMHHWINKINISKLPMSAFPHLRKICTTGYIVDPKGKNIYMIHPERMSVHTLYISGGRSLLVTPKTSFLANQYMKLHQPDYKHKRVVVDGFGHSDLLIGEESSKKVFPHIISHITDSEQEEQRVLANKETGYKKEALSWSWDDDPWEMSKYRLISWIRIISLLGMLSIILMIMASLV